MKVLIKTLLLLLVFVSCKKSGEKKRTTILLNGTWQIAEGTKDQIPDEFNHAVVVPGLVSLAQPAFKDAGIEFHDFEHIRVEFKLLTKEYKKPNNNKGGR